MDITIRRAHEDELKIVQDLNHDLFLWDFNRDPVLNVNWPHEPAGEDYFRKKISGEAGVCFVAVVDNEVIGYVAGYVSDKVHPTETIRRSELDNIFVKPEFHGKGAGTLLTKAFLAWAKSVGADSAVVSGYVANEQAMEFYKHVGFKPLTLKLEIKL